MQRRFLKVSIVGFVVLAGAAGLVVWGWRGAETRSQPVLLARRVTPDAATGDVIQAERHQRVRLEYELTNAGNTALEGLSLRLPCACQIDQKPPARLAPGETARIAFHLSAPPAGMHELTAMIQQAGRSDPLLAMPNRIQAKMPVPGWLTEPRDLQLRFVEGHSQSAEVILQTIEMRDAAPWLEAITIEPPDRMSLAVSHSDDFRVQDPQLCIRKYQLRFSAADLVVGQYRGLVRIRASGADPSKGVAITCTAEVLPRLSVFPKTLTLGAGDRERVGRVVLVDRAGTGADIEVVYNSAYLNVERVIDSSARSLVYEVGSTGATHPPAAAPVTFSTADGMSSTLEVHLHADAQ